MRIYWLLIMLCITVLAAPEKYFMVQFGTFKIDEYEKAEMLRQKLQERGIGSQLYEDVEHDILIVQSKAPLRYSQVENLQTILKDLQFFPVPSSEKQPILLSHPTINKADVLFGENNTLVHLMEEGLDFRQKLAETKTRYLALQKQKMETSGLSLNLDAERALKRERNGYTTELSWDLLDNGYFGSRKEAERKVIQESISFERMTENLIENYSRVANYEIEDIKHYISLIFAKRKRKKIEKYLSIAKQKLEKGFITKWDYNKIAVFYQKNKTALDYLSHKAGKPFSKKYASLIENIENTKLLDAEMIRNYTLQNAPVLKMEKERAKLLSNQENWQEKVKAEVYLSRKEYTFIQRDETLAGVEIEIPLDGFDDDKELMKLEKMYSGWKRKSLEMLLQKEVDNLLEELTTYKEQIAKIRKEMAHRQEQVALAKQGLEQVSRSSDQTIWSVTLELIDLEKELWLKRADILSALLKLQYLSGLRVL